MSKSTWDEVKKRAEELESDAHKLVDPTTSPIEVQKALRHLGGIQVAREVKEGFSVKPKAAFLVIGLGGYYGAGKDVYADAVVASDLPFSKTFMSKFLQRCIQTINPWIRIDKELRVSGYVTLGPGNFIKYREIEDLVGYTGAKKQDEVREWLQLMGTEVGRKILGEDTWVNLLREELCEIQDSGRHAVITGIRYPNELDLIHEFGGKSVWVTRPGFEPTGATSTHSSERTLGPADFDYEVLNDGELEDLERKAVTQAGGWLL